MKKLLLISMMLLMLLFIGCSDDDNPVIDDGNTTTIVVADSTIWSAVDNAWISNVDASSYTDSIAFTFADSSKALDWHLMLRRYYINLNGGDYNATGDVVGADLGLADFDTISIDDTAGVTWIADSNSNYLDGSTWYTYNFQTHQLDLSGNVLSIVDAEGDNYVKFTIDSITGAAAPPAMGTVHITFYYQSTANSRNLNGTTVHDSIVVDAAHGYAGYYDFSSGAQVTPATPESSTGWDIKLANYEIYQNSGPFGIGNVAGYKAFTDSLIMNDPTNIDGLTVVNNFIPYLPDFVSSVFYRDGEDDSQNWYDYQPENNHLIVSWGRVYLIKTEGRVFVFQILEYYDQDSGESGHITFKWRQL